MTPATAGAGLCAALAVLAGLVARPGGWFDRRHSAAVAGFESRLELERRVLPGAIAIAYTLAGYATGLALLAGPAGPAGWRWIAGTALLAHAMTAALYLEHECTHALLARSKRWNAALGAVFGWIDARIYVAFGDIARMHLQHHHRVCDFEGFDVAGFVTRARTRPVGRLVLGLEAIHVPILHFVIRAHGLAAALRDPARRLRTFAVLAIRGSAFTALAARAPAAAAGYLVAYVIYVQTARFVDAFQHAYPERRALPAGAGRRDRYLEQSLTFSLPLAHRLRFLNLLILNFGYHSAHHAFLRCPWYDLPSVHDALVADPALAGRRVGASQRASLGEMFRFYHRHRLARLDRGQGIAWDDAGALSFERFHGAFTDKLGFLDPDLGPDLGPAPGPDLGPDLGSPRSSA
jgi:fatty acid desaturase